MQMCFIVPALQHGCRENPLYVCVIGPMRMSLLLKNYVTQYGMRTAESTETCLDLLVPVCVRACVRVRACVWWWCGGWCGVGWGGEGGEGVMVLADALPSLMVFNVSSRKHLGLCQLDWRLVVAPIYHFSKMQQCDLSWVEQVSLLIGTHVLLRSKTIFTRK